MKTIKPYYTIIHQEDGIEGIYDQIETAGKNCYQSKKTGDPKKFVDRMIKLDHFAMLEHGTVYLKTYSAECAVRYMRNPYSRVNKSEDGFCFYITTNYRVLVENDWLADMQYYCDYTHKHDRRVMVRFIMDRIGSQSFVRHRVFSFAQESTRYCSYYSERFGSNVTFIVPSYIKDEHIPRAISYLEKCEKEYFDWIELGYTAEEARFVLASCIKTDLVMTGFADDWCHFFDLRAFGTTGKPHPQALELAMPLFGDMCGKGLLDV